MMKIIPVQEAIGSVLCHDVTRIVPGETKGRAFKKGHVVGPEDIQVLLDIGKEHLYVLDLSEGLIHENEAAERIARAAAGPGLTLTEPSEGRVNFEAAYNGLLKINLEALEQINTLENIIIGTMHTNHRVTAGRPVAGTRIIPLVLEDAAIRQVEDICREYFPVIQVKPFRPWRVGMVTTGSEVYHGRIEDKFGPVVRDKFSELGSTVFKQVLVSDDVDITARAINGLIAEGAEMVVVTGGMSVDPDDQTPAGIRAAGGQVVAYGAPAFPGAMFLLAYINEIPVMGLPGCVMYYQATIFDLVAPRILAGETVTRRDIVALGHGGFCAGCSPCRYPVCGFGKGR